MPKPRLLIPISIQFSVRYVVRSGLLEHMRAFAAPAVALGWDDPALQAELEGCGVPVYRLAPAAQSQRYRRLRRWLQDAFFARSRSATVGIDARRDALGRSDAENAKIALRGALCRALGAVEPAYRALQRRESRLVCQETSIRQSDALLDAARPDALLSLTPYYAEEEFLLRSAARRGIPLGAAILSFDNLTTKGWLPAPFDHYFLWNTYNRDELWRLYPETKERPVSITGTPQFDFYYRPEYLWDEATWRAKLGLPPGRPVILYAAGPASIVPHEPHWVAQIDAAIEDGSIAGRPVILLRRHPVDPAGRWLPLLRQGKHIVFDEPWQPGAEVIGKTNVSDEDIRRLASSLCYARVHVSGSSTMAIDGAIFDRPQINPAYDDRPGRPFDRAMRELYLREHYLPITRSGGIQIVGSRAALVAAINDGFAHPERGREGRRRMVAEICTYTDGHSTERVAAALEEFLRSKIHSGS